MKNEKNSKLKLSRQQEYEIRSNFKTFKKKNKKFES